MSNLKLLRKKIDRIDRILIFLLNRRTKHALEIGRKKAEMNKDVFDPQREKEIFIKLEKMNKGPMSQESLKKIYEKIIEESRHAQNDGQKKKNGGKVNFSSLLTRKQLAVVAGVFLLVLALLCHAFYSPNYYPSKGPLDFEIKKGETISRVIDRLYKAKIISKKFNMRLAVMVYLHGREFKAGVYEVPNGMSYLDLIDFFTWKGTEKAEVITIPEGSSNAQIARILSRKLEIDSEKVIALCNDTAFIRKLGVKEKSLEGYLLPDSYFFPKKTTAEAALKKMHEEFQKFYKSYIKEKLGRQSLHEIITMASIVDGESNYEKEFPDIASVYYNRLHTGMKLQADPTVQYATNEPWHRLTLSDLQVKSPYNTYMHYGLPPGPINNPGRAAIKAALEPAKTKNLYFVADGSGAHTFSVSYGEHLKKVKNYRAIRDSH